MKNSRPVISILLLLFLIINSTLGQQIPERQKQLWLEKAEQLTPVLQERIIEPKAVVVLRQNRNAFQGWEAVKIAEPDTIYNNSFRTLKSITVDFGDHYTGYFSFDLNVLRGTADAPLRFKLTFAEVPGELATPFDPYPGELSRAWLQDEVVTVMNVPSTFTLERRVAFRYVRIELLGSSQYFDFNISAMRFTAVTSATQTPSPLPPSTSPVISRIDQVGLKTLQECMQTVYEDGPKRDRRLWVGDLYLEALANMYSYQNHDLTKRSLYLLAGLSDPEGYVLGTVFETPEPHAQAGQRLLDYSLLYNVTLRDYLLATNDTETALDLWPVARRQLQIVSKYVDENGLIDFEQASRDWWIFIEWKEGLHKHAAIQGLIIFTLKQTLDLAVQLNRQHEVSHLPRLINSMSSASLKNFYNRRSGLFESGPQKQVSYASQTWMVLAGVLSPRDSRKALNAVIKHPDALYPGGPYMYHYFIQALINSGLNDLAYSSLVDYWGGMVNKGADTFWEVYDPNNDFLSPYNFFPINSYCHAWSCTPVYFIRKYPEIFK